MIAGCAGIRRVQLQRKSNIALWLADPNMDNIAKLCCIWRKLADSPEQLATEGLGFLKRTYKDVWA